MNDSIMMIPRSKFMALLEDRQAAANAVRGWKAIAYAAICCSVVVLGMAIWKIHHIEPVVIEAEPEIVAETVEVEGFTHYDVPLPEYNQDILTLICQWYGIDVRIPLAIMQKETGFQNVTGDGGDSVGYMQVQPKWHKARMERLGISKLDTFYGNAIVGCDFIAELLSEHSLANALAAYNSGDPALPNQYAEDVMDIMEGLEVR